MSQTNEETKLMSFRATFIAHSKQQPKISFTVSGATISEAEDNAYRIAHTEKALRDYRMKSLDEIRVKAVDEVA